MSMVQNCLNWSTKYHTFLLVKSIKQYVNLDLKEIVSNGFLAFFDSSLIGEAPQKSLPKSANGKSWKYFNRYTPLSPFVVAVWASLLARKISKFDEMYSLSSLPKCLFSAWVPQTTCIWVGWQFGMLVGFLEGWQAGLSFGYSLMVWLKTVELPKSCPNICC